MLRFCHYHYRNPCLSMVPTKTQERKLNMQRKSLIIFIAFISHLFLFASIAYAIQPLPVHLIALTSQQGEALLKENMTVTAVKLLSNFVTQKEPTFCGVASAVMILNSTNLNAPEDLQHPRHYYFTQDNFFNDKVNSIVSLDEVKKKGLSLKKLGDALRTFGLNIETVYANEIDQEIFKKELINALSKQKMVIVNFLRTKLQQTGSGHHSPVVAYDALTDRFLVLDVARYKYLPFWIKTEDLWNSIHIPTKGGIYRGFLIIDPS
jgi:hypothetical protein